MHNYFPASSVRSSSTEANAAPERTTNPVARVFVPPWAQNVPNYNPIFGSLYPHLPPPTPSCYGRVPPPSTPPSPSATSADDDTIMAEAENYEDEAEDVDGTPLDAVHPGHVEGPNAGGCSSDIDVDDDDEDSGSEYEVDLESEDETLYSVRTTRASSVKEKKNAIKAAEAANKRTSRARTAKAAKLSKTTATSTSVKGSRKKNASSKNVDAPARRTRSSIAQPPVAQIIKHRGVEIAPLGRAQKFKTRKTWTDEDKCTLTIALRHWWKAEGAAAYNYPSKIVIPKKRKDECWLWLWAECKKIDPQFNRNATGMQTVAGTLKKKGLL
ncbi:hypothetical protein FRC01_000148 [Tulasnella sp. 417]|nr:hypothetical protein FRC01_000148 [Tulasnella sp. 417]